MLPVRASRAFTLVTVPLSPKVGPRHTCLVHSPPGKKLLSLKAAYTHFTHKHGQMAWIPSVPRNDIRTSYCVPFPSLGDNPVSDFGHYD